jgi:hypothetical protein
VPEPVALAPLAPLAPLPRRAGAPLAALDREEGDVVATPASLTARPDQAGADGTFVDSRAEAFPTRRSPFHSTGQSRSDRDQLDLHRRRSHLR